MTLAGPAEITQQTHRAVPAPIVLGLWLLSLGLLLAGIGNPPVTRTQEARVLETARQMLGADWHGWVVPTLNGEPRLNKPPLCYWLTAAAYKVGGIGEGVGRVPTAVLGWLTLGMTYVFARRLFDQRTALISAAALLGSMHFFRFTRLAETDAAAMCFLTLAIYLLWRGMEVRRLLWMHAAAVAIALVILAKGVPAIFVLVFLLGLGAIESHWDVARRFVISGAPITLLVLAAPWFYFGGETAAAEMRNTLSGGNHFGWPWDYVKTLFVATAPWSAFLPLALIDAVRRWKADPSTRLTLIWFLSILVPLCINGNKQDHYLVLLTPALMILVGRVVASTEPAMQKWLKRLLALTLVGCLAGAVVGPMAAFRTRGESIPLDWIAAGALALAALIVWLRLRRSVPAGISGMLAVVALLMPVVLGLWLPSFAPENVRDTARQIKQLFGTRQYVFVGPGNSVPLCFEMRTVIPFANTVDELLAIAKPGAVAIALSKDGTPFPPLPEAFVYRIKIDAENQELALYEFEPP